MADTAVTISRTKVSVIPLPERNGGFTHKFHVDYTDVNTGTGSTDTVTMTLGTIGSASGAWAISRCLVQVTTAFAGTTAFTVQVGTTTATNAALAAASVLTAGAKIPSTGINQPSTVASCHGTSTISVVAVFTNATGGSPSALSAGALDIFVHAFDPTRIDGNVANN